MVPELLLFALLFGWIFGGKFWRLADAQIRYGWLFFIPIGMYLAAWGVAFLPWHEKLSWFSGVSHVVEKSALIMLAAANWRLPGAKLILLGMGMNLAALLANGGLMPASPGAIASAFGSDYLEATRAAKHVRSAIMDASCSLGFLCDIIAAKRPFVLVPAVYSIGDLIMSTGIFIALISLMRTPLPGERTALAKEAQVESEQA